MQDHGKSTKQTLKEMTNQQPSQKQQQHTCPIRYTLPAIHAAVRLFAASCRKPRTKREKKKQVDRYCSGDSRHRWLTSNPPRPLHPRCIANGRGCIGGGRWRGWTLPTFLFVWSCYVYKFCNALIICFVLIKNALQAAEGTLEGRQLRTLNHRPLKALCFLKRL